MKAPRPVPLRPVPAARSLSRAAARESARGVALIAVLMAMTLLLLLALPFAVSMSRGAQVAVHAVEVRQAELASASVRDLLLGGAGLGHPTYDETPDCDGEDEFAARVPDVFPALRRDGRTRLGGELHDLQRLIALEAATPLLLANLLGSTARLAARLEPDASALQIDGGAELPDQGFVWCDHELIRYGGRQGNALVDLERGLQQERGFLRPDDHTVEIGALVLDHRCVLAACWSFDGRSGGTRLVREPLADPGQLAEIGRAGCGEFSRRELDRLEAVLAGAADATAAPVWGRPERVFADLLPPRPEDRFPGTRRLVVRSALHLGAGSPVRIRHLPSGRHEYALVMATSSARPGEPLTVLLPSTFYLDLLLPVTQEFPAIDTVVEPLVPPPVNVNTASAEVLAALFQGVRPGRDVRVHQTDREPAPPEAPISASEARELAGQIVASRAAHADGPFRGFREFAERLFAPRFEEAADIAGRLRWVYLYRALLTGRDSQIEMGTAPVCFASGPLVAYRAAASVQRSSAAAGIAARHERTGIAVAMPGLRLLRPWQTQEQLEEAFRLDQRARGWRTDPINTGGSADEPGNDPAPRHFAHVIAMAFPGVGLGESRFPARTAADSAIAPATAAVPYARWGVPGAREERGHESFATATDPRGHDVSRDGPFLIANTGPTGTATPPAEPRTHDLRFPFTGDAGGARRFGLGFWIEPDALQTGTLLDYGDGKDPDRNRISVQVRDAELLFEVLDEAGLDPDPSQSPAGVERTAAEWRLPLDQLQLPPRTPLHLCVAAYGNRPGDLSVAVDGWTRGERRYRTWLTAPLPPLDPAQFPEGPLGQSPRDPRFVEVQVESTEGFPQKGVLRIGLELFEYTDLTPGTFLCVRRDSAGGRGFRQRPREQRDDFETDGAGRPTVRWQDLPANRAAEVEPGHPAGAEVELYGYVALPSRDVIWRVGETAVAGTVGAWSVARGWIQNGRSIAVEFPNGGSFTLGEGLDETWSGSLQLCDPVPTGAQDPAAASTAVADGFPSNGGFALLVQRLFRFQPAQGGLTTAVGGIEVISYSRRSGSVLEGVQRAAALPGDDRQGRANAYDGLAHKFVTKWARNVTEPGSPPIPYSDVPTAILWVVPISLPLQNARDLPDPQQSGLSEWVQLLPRGDDTTDTEWVRYDALLNSHIVRADRGAWANAWFQLTFQRDFSAIDVGPLGPTNGQGLSPDAPWGQVRATSGEIGYVPQLESDFPQIHHARGALAFRGDPLTGTSSHPQPDSVVVPCHRLQLEWGNYAPVFTARPGRFDRVALIPAASAGADGMTRPSVEWHTVNWSMRYYATEGPRNADPGERLGVEPFQLVAFREGIRRTPLVGPGPTTATLDTRQMDRMVKFPGGELPAAHCKAVALGGGVAGGEIVDGLVDEIEVAEQVAESVCLSAGMTADAPGFTTLAFGRVDPHGLVFLGDDWTARFPAGGGLVAIDDEILAYRGISDGVFVIAENGRGLLGTEPRAHDRGAQVHFLTHRPAAILLSGVQPTGDELPVQAGGAMPPRSGTGLLGRTELLHWTWSRLDGETLTFSMPRAFPPGEDGDSTGGHGLFRGRYGTTPVGAGANEPLIAMPFRYWDRHVERNDDPDLHYFQFTSREAPVFFRGLRWREETTDRGVDVVCNVRADDRAAWHDDPRYTPGLWRLERAAGDDQPALLGLQATQLELRFATVYLSGCLDLVGGQAHGWKTAPRIERIELEYEGEGRILQERVTAR